MSQNDFNLANQGFPSMRADMNSALQALATNSSGTSAPGTTYAYQWWYDETNDILKFRNADNDAWIEFASFDQTNDTWSAVTSGSISGRNLIINGSGRINQRGYTSGAATSGANEYTLDRWRVVTSGQNLTFTGDDSARTMTAPAGGVEQVIEGVNVVGGTYIISFTGTATCTVGGVTRASGDTFTLTANTNVTVRFTSGTFTDVQIEAGNIATPFERRPVGTELALCQRYYQVGSLFAQGSHSKTLAAMGIGAPLSVHMRAGPTVQLTLTSSGGYSSSLSAQGVSFRSIGFNAVFTDVSGAFAFVDYTADAEL